MGCVELVQMRRGTFARWYFSRPWQCIRASFTHVSYSSSGSTTHVLKREIRCCAYCNYGSFLFSNLGGGVRRVILMEFYLLRRTPPPHTLAPIGVWCGLQWLSIRQQARSQGHEKSHSLSLPFLGFFMGYERAAAQDMLHQVMCIWYWFPCPAAQQGIICHETASRLSINFINMSPHPQPATARERC